MNQAVSRRIGEFEPPISYRCVTCGNGSYTLRLICPVCSGQNTYRRLDAFQITEAARETAPAGQLITGWKEFDEFSPGVLQKGSVCALYARAGCGKSTLALSIAAAVGTQAHSLYFSTEEAESTLKVRLLRITGGQSPLGLVIRTGSSIQEFVNAIGGHGPALAVVDSISRIRDEEEAGEPGGMAQIRRCAATLMSLARSAKTAIIAVSHTNKAGSVAGWGGISFDSDSILTMRGRGNIRVLVAEKNRHGSTEDVLLFRMTPAGLVPLSKDATLPHRNQQAPGVAFSVQDTEGHYIVGEVQAAYHGNSILCDGIGPRVKSIILSGNGAVARKNNLHLRSYFPTPVVDRACDLAVLAAVISAAKKKPLPKDSVFIGEVDPMGNVLTVPDLSDRLRAASKLGFRICFANPTQARERVFDTVAVERRGEDRMTLIPIRTTKEIHPAAFGRAA